jgi:hypothetical protein
MQQVEYVSQVGLVVKWSFEAEEVGVKHLQLNKYPP